MTLEESRLNLEGSEIAVECGLIFNGIQLDAQEEPFCFLFTDPETRGTFAAYDAASAKTSLENLRAKFETDP